jgi:hypothetical protein
MAPAATGRPRTARQLRGASLGFACLLAACRSEPSRTTIDLVLPDGVGRRVELVPKSAFAEYVELPELRQELRITLASYELSCHEYVAPGPSDTLLVVTLTAPASEPLKPGAFPLEAAARADAGAVTRSTAYAVAREGARGFEFPAGGRIDLRAFDPSASGQVTGTLALEFPGDGRRPPAGARGRFEARMCQTR